MTKKTTKSTHDRIVGADNAACRHLGNYNEAKERGAEKTAEREFWKAQRALDRLNKLRGQGSDD